MKKTLLISASFFIVLMISIGIVDSISVLTRDINTHAWQNLIGRWRSCERGFYEIEFKPDGTFVEYSHGIGKGAGTFQIIDNSVEVRYDAPGCTPGKKNSCAVRMEFEFVAETLILTTGGQEARYKRTDD